jgi:hypothetical protein
MTKTVITMLKVLLERLLAVLTLSQRLIIFFYITTKIFTQTKSSVS